MPKLPALQINVPGLKRAPFLTFPYFMRMLTDPQGNKGAAQPAVLPGITIWQHGASRRHRHLTRHVIYSRR